VLGKHSGRHALKSSLIELGFGLTDAELGKAFDRFKALADKKKTITDADLEAIVADQIYQPVEVFALEEMQVVCGTLGMPTATVRLRGPDGASTVRAAMGTGPVDSVYKAIDEIVGVPNTLLEFVINAVTEGIDAQGEVTVRIEGRNGHSHMDPQSEMSAPRTFGGHGSDTDIIVASARAYLSALNKLLVATGKYGVPESVAEVAGAD
jgi:2-isopropylmalate synthase